MYTHTQILKNSALSYCIELIIIRYKFDLDISEPSVQKDSVKKPCRKIFTHHMLKQSMSQKINYIDIYIYERESLVHK